MDGLCARASGERSPRKIPFTEAGLLDRPENPAQPMKGYTGLFERANRLPKFGIYILNGNTHKDRICHNVANVNAKNCNRNDHITTSLH